MGEGVLLPYSLSAVGYKFRQWLNPPGPTSAAPAFSLDSGKAISSVCSFGLSGDNGFPLRLVPWMTGATCHP